MIDYSKDELSAMSRDLKKNQLLNKVEPEILNLALRLTGIGDIPIPIIEKLMDLIELIDYTDGNPELMDICLLEELWKDQNES